MTPEQKDALIDAFRRAELASLSAKGDEDGGTCNIDTPAFRIDRCSEGQIQDAAQRAGVRVDSFTWLGGRRWFWLEVTTYGQGNMLARMSTAASKVLSALETAGTVPGFHACQYCQMD
jgi:hypothetical protein